MAAAARISVRPMASMVSVDPQPVTITKPLWQKDFWLLTRYAGW
jgi:hypothetical protein